MPRYAQFNTAELKRALRVHQTEYRQVLREAMPAISRNARDRIRNRIPPGATTRSGMTNPFPGYAATGNLKSNVVAGPVKEVNGIYIANVGIAVHANRHTKMVFVVHEYGKVIHARPDNPTGLMSFRVQGQWVRTPRVRIKAKRFFRSGWDEARRQFPEILNENIVQRWP